MEVEWLQPDYPPHLRSHAPLIGVPFRLRGDGRGVSLRTFVFLGREGWTFHMSTLGAEVRLGRHLCRTCRTAFHILLFVYSTRKQSCLYRVPEKGELEMPTMEPFAVFAFYHLGLDDEFSQFRNIHDTACHFQFWRRSGTSWSGRK